MRIAVASLETHHHRATDETERLRRVVEGLADRGHDVEVCCARFWDGEDRTWSVDGVTYRGVAGSTESRERFYAGLPNALRKARPDVIHASAAPPGTVLAARTGAGLARAPLVVEWYDPSDRLPGGRVERQAVRRAHRVIAPSRLVRRKLWELGAAEDEVSVVPTGIDIGAIESIGPDDRYDVVFTRRLDADAHLDSLLLGLAEHRDRGVSVAVIGDGPERRAYERQTRELRIDDRVDFLGELPRPGRIAIYRGAHVFVQTARRCPFATELCWALAAGCVGIVEYHADSSAHELVEGRERGFRTTSETEMAEALVAAGDHEHRTIDRAFEGFDDDAVLERYLECYREADNARGLF